MKSYKLVTADKDVPCDNTKKYRIKSLDVIKQDLNLVKSQLDDSFKERRFGTYWSLFDPFKNERNIVAKIGNTINVSNAWLKCCEIILHYQLINEKNNKLLHFDNAAFPGSFIISTHHIVKTQMPTIAYEWVASSLLDANTSNVNPLEDKYGLYKNYKTNWLMSNKNNGDVLIEKNQLDFFDRIGNKVDLYTSDLGFDVSSDFNNQEYMQLPANIGQIISGLLTLKKGGSFITKQYTIFEPTTISVMYLAATFFDEFYICKPVTSRMANSETYLVGKGFKGNISPAHPYIKALLDKSTGKSKLDIPIVDARYYPKEFLNTIIQCARELANSQIKKINDDIQRCNDCIKSYFTGPPNKNPIVINFIKDNEFTIEEWYMKHPVLPIDDDNKLKMTNALYQ